MAERSLNSPGADAQPLRPRLTFGPFTLDLGRAELLLDGQALPIRPKAFDLLTALATRPGQVLSKDELVAAVWPGVVVTDDSLTQCVHELRNALGDAGPVLLRTVPRRGYRFDAEVRAEPPPAPATPATPPAPAVPPVVTAVTLDAPAGTGRARRRMPMLLVAGLLGAALLLAGVAWLATNGSASRGQTPAELARAPLPREVPPLSIIVLPLTIEGDAPEDARLAEVLHGDLINQVARLQGSLVISRDTAATYKGRTIDPRQVAREMGVRHVVQGSLRQDGTSVHLNIALIDGETGAQRWADTFVTERARLTQTVGDFSAAIEHTLTGEVVRTTAERGRELSPTEVTADDLAIQGVALWYRGGATPDNLLAALALFERAVAMDPDSARAWAGIGLTIPPLLFNSWVADRPAALRRHEEAVTNLERINRDGAYTFGARAFQLVVKRGFPALLLLTTEWTERYGLPLAWCAHGPALYFNGRFDEAVPALERALRLGPRDPFRAECQYRLSMAHFGAGHYELARDWSLAAAATNAALTWPPVHAAALQRLGRHDEARQAFAEHMRRHPGTTAVQVTARLPSQEPRFAEARERLVGSLRELGLP